MKRILSVLCASLLVCSCSSNGGKIQFKESGSISAFTNAIKSVEVVPLATDTLHLLGGSVNMLLRGDSYVLYDVRNSKIYRYSLSGEFMNEIGRKGNGPGEYANMCGVQAVNEGVIVFSYPDKMLKYKFDGTLIASDKVAAMGLQSCETEDGLLSYYGYGSVGPYRAALIDKDKIASKFLETNAKILNFTPDAPIFTEDEGYIYFIDAFNPTIMKYKNKKVEPYLTFDFGKYAVPEKYYQFKEPFEAATYLMGLDFAVINRYMQNKNLKFVEVVINQKDHSTAVYGFAKGNKWNWFSVGNPSESPLAGSFKIIKDNVIYCLINPAMLDKMPKEFENLISNKDVLRGVKEESNYIVAKVYMK